MHEFGITESIIKIALDKAKEVQASEITQINLVVGELSGFVPDCIQFYFDFLSKDTIAEKTALRFELTPAQLRCRNCSVVFHPKDLSTCNAQAGSEWNCPECHGQSVEIMGGRELYVKSIEVE